MRAKYTHLLDYFGEDRNMRSHELFTSLYRFVLEFAEVRDRVDRLKRTETMIAMKTK